jgi:predicted glutamine amidotransferase
MIEYVPDGDAFQDRFELAFSPNLVYLLTMCRLFGIVGTHPLPVREALEAFLPLGKSGRVKCTMKPGHLDGWGVSGYSAKRAVYFDRRAEPVTESNDAFVKAADKAARSQSPVVIGHLRKASEGGRDISNTHPFHSRDWIFAHNGTIYGAVASMTLRDSHPQGQTDSERLFLWILEHIRNEPDRTAALAQFLKKHRDTLVFSALNFLMTDGKELWAYRDYGDKRMEPGETLREREIYYTLYYTRVERSAVVCSEPLTDVSKFWQPLAPRTLAAFNPSMLAPRTLTI